MPRPAIPETSLLRAFELLCAGAPVSVAASEAGMSGPTLERYQTLLRSGGRVPQAETSEARWLAREKARRLVEAATAIHLHRRFMGGSPPRAALRDYQAARSAFLPVLAETVLSDHERARVLADLERGDEARALQGIGRFLEALRGSRMTFEPLIMTEF